MENRTLLSCVMMALFLLPTVSATDQAGPGQIRLLASIDFWLDPLAVQSYYYTDCEDGDRLYGSFEVTSGSNINFFICDRNTYDSYKNGSTVGVYELSEYVESLSYSFTLPSDGIWHIVFENNDSVYQQHIEGSVYHTSAAQEALAVVLSVIPVALVAVVLVFGAVLYSQSKKRAITPTMYSPPPESTHVAPSPQMANSCPHCGAARSSPMDGFCAVCGHPYSDGPGLR